MAIILEQEDQVHRRQIFEERIHTLKLLRESTKSDTMFIGFIPIPDHNEVKLSQGTVLKVTFSSPSSHDSQTCLLQTTGGATSATHQTLLIDQLRGQTWTAQVARRSLDDPSHLVRVFLDRPDLVRKQFSSADPVSQIPVLKKIKAKTQVAQTLGISVTIRVEESDKIFQRSAKACRILTGLESGGEMLPWTEKTLRFTTARSLDNLPISDIFRPVRDLYPNPENLMELNDAQNECVKAARSAPLGVQIIHGPAGTGKSFTVAQYVIPFLQATSHHTILIVSETNRAVDALARDINDHLESLKTKVRVPKDRYVIRLHSENLEQGIITRAYTKRSSPQNPEGTKTSSDQTQTAIETISDCGIKVRQLDSRDARLQERSLSAAAKILELATTDPKGFRAFDHICKELVNEDEWLDGLSPSYHHAYANLFSRVVAEASIILTTTATATSPELLKAIGPHVSLVIVDEAARNRDDLLIPIFAAPFSRDPGLVLVGDHKQLSPMARANPEDNPLVDQLKISTMFRLIELGFPFSRLDSQYRMVPQIGALSNQLIYGGSLLNDKSVWPRNRPLARKFSRAAATLFKITPNPERYVFYLDYAEKGFNLVEVDRRKSRYNKFIAAVVVNTLVQLLSIDDQAKICVLTGYAAQKTRYETARKNMENAQLPGWDRIGVDTIDSCQGEQFDFVVVDMVNSELGHWLGDPKRLNVALTRARNGLVIIGSNDAFQRWKSHSRLLSSFGDMLARYRIEKVHLGTYPPCEYYSPSTDYDSA